MSEAKFVLDIEKFAQEADLSMEQTARAVILEMSARVIQRSPVDTGRFRSNWFANVVTTTDEVLSGDVVISRASSAAAGYQLDQEFTLNNNLPYAERLEFGYSGQAPGGMVRVTAEEFTTVVNEKANG